MRVIGDKSQGSEDACLAHGVLGPLKDRCCLFAATRSLGEGREGALELLVLLLRKGREGSTTEGSNT